MGGVKINSEYITTEQLCEWLKIHENTAYNWRKLGMPYVKVGNTVRYDKEAIKKWLESQEK